MKKTLFWLSEINALLWLAMFGFIVSSAASQSSKIMAGVGLAIGAWMQHRAYHDIYKKKA